MALPTPERVDLGGRCVLPAFTDSHVHFPTWSLARHDVRLEDVASLAEALQQSRARRDGLWVRGTGWRDAGWEARPTAAALDAVTGDRPAALWSKDYHSLWLNSAALRLAGGDLEVDGGVVERDEDEAPTGVLREEAAWSFRSGSSRSARRSGSRRPGEACVSRTGAASARSTTRTAGWGAAGIYAASSTGA